MADNVDLQARERDTRGKNAARRLRASGMTPAVLYGEGNEAGGSTALAVPTKIVDYTLHHFGDNALYNIDFDGATSTARVVDAQRDPVSGVLIHVDFAPVDMLERIEVTVPLGVIGEAPGVEEGGVLQQSPTRSRWNPSPPTSRRRSRSTSRASVCTKTSTSATSRSPKA